MNDHVGPNPEPTIEEAFLRFHRQNPSVYWRLVQLARTWQTRRPGRKAGIGMLFEVLRWEVTILGPTTGDDFKLNNNYRSYYARLIMSSHPELDGVFETRRLHAVEPF